MLSGEATCRGCPRPCPGITRRLSAPCLQAGACHSIRQYVTNRHVTQRNISGRPLTGLQQAILNFIWSKGLATSEQVREALLPRHPLKDSSVRTLLRRLEARGYLDHQLVGNTYVYRAAIPARSVAARAVRHIIDRFCAGSVEQFLVGMIDENVISRREIARLARKVKKQR
jgi:BlaI family transcriptional regulator, penicillinase repressor